jgi:S-DNA-T family DNA segregation ATPase FtsK/SpoIIIE
LDFKDGGDFSGMESEYDKHRYVVKNQQYLMVSNVEKARELLDNILIEVSGRLEYFKQAGVSNIDEFNVRPNNTKNGPPKFNPWLVVIDEAAEILDVKPKDKAEKELYAEIDSSLRTLARTSRAAGIHILMGVIRPDSNILDGQIKNNLLWRVCGYFADSPASRIVLDNDKATELPPDVKGRFIIGDDEVQAYYMPLPRQEMDGNS